MVIVYIVLPTPDDTKLILELVSSTPLTYKVKREDTNIYITVTPQGKLKALVSDYNQPCNHNAMSRTNN